MKFFEPRGLALVPLRLNSGFLISGLVLLIVGLLPKGELVEEENSGVVDDGSDLRIVAMSLVA